jgi:hypothetical protein
MRRVLLEPLDAVMPISLPRMTTRRWMVLVAVLAVPLAAVSICIARAAHFQGIAGKHQSQVQIGATPFKTFAGTCYYLTDLGLWHADMAAKYERAARYPWLPVPPDPPEPK